MSRGRFGSNDGVLLSTSPHSHSAASSRSPRMQCNVILKSEVVAVVRTALRALRGHILTDVATGNVIDLIEQVQLQMHALVVAPVTVPADAALIGAIGTVDAEYDAVWHGLDAPVLKAIPTQTAITDF